MSWAGYFCGKALDRGYQVDLVGHAQVSGGELSSCIRSERIQWGRFFSQFIHLVLLYLQLWEVCCMSWGTFCSQPRETWPTQTGNPSPLMLTYFERVNSSSLTSFTCWLSSYKSSIWQCQCCCLYQQTITSLARVHNLTNSAWHYYSYSFMAKEMQQQLSSMASAPNVCGIRSAKALFEKFSHTPPHLANFTVPRGICVQWTELLRLNAICNQASVNVEMYRLLSCSMDSHAV